MNIFASLPAELALNYTVTPAGSTTRVIPNAKTEIIAAAKSSMPPERILHHPGIIQTNVYELTLPPGAKPK